MGLSWASRCVRCRSSPPNTDRCRNHLCWHTEHGDYNGETRLNIHPYLWGGDWKWLDMTNACQICNRFLSQHRWVILDQHSGEKKKQGAVCFKPAWEIILQHPHGWKQNMSWVSPQLSGWAMSAHQINMVSRSCCQSTCSHDPSWCQLTQMRRTCGAVLWSI